MPSNWLYIDSNFPTFTGEENLKEQVTTIQNYMYMLVEQLRYTLHNLDLSNMNEAAVDDWENAITEPIYIHLEDSDERITQLAITAAGLSARMEDAEGNITTLQATATGLAAQITDAEGDIAALQVTADGLSSTVANQAGQISSLQQTVGSFSLSVSNGESSSTIYLSANGAVIDSARVTFTGMVLFADLETSGATVINGDNITTGTIFADIIHLGGRVPHGQRVLPGRLYRIHVRHDGFREFHSGNRHCQQQRGGGGDLHHQRRPDGIRRRLHGGVHQYAGLHHRGHGIHQWGAGHNLRRAAEDGEAVRCGEIPGRV